MTYETPEELGKPWYFELLLWVDVDNSDELFEELTEAIASVLCKDGGSPKDPDHQCSTPWEMFGQRGWPEWWEK